MDFDAVQRGDAEMEQKLNRVIRSCLELGEKNPICSIHDQGAGGNGGSLYAALKFLVVRRQLTTWLHHITNLMHIVSSSTSYVCMLQEMS